MTLEVLTPISIRFDGDVVRFPAGAVFTVTANQAARLLDLAPKKLRRITLPAASDEAQPPPSTGVVGELQGPPGQTAGRLRRAGPGDRADVYVERTGLAGDLDQRGAAPPLAHRECRTDRRTGPGHSRVDGERARI